MIFTRGVRSPCLVPREDFGLEEVEIECRALAELGFWRRSGTSGTAVMKTSRALDIQTLCHLCTGTRNVLPVSISRDSKRP